MKYNLGEILFFYFYLNFSAFFMDPDFVRTQEKKFTIEYGSETLEKFV